MQDTQIILAALWACLMLIYLWGDILSVLAGDAKPGELGGKKVGSGFWLGIAIVQLLPIIMIFLSLVFLDSVNRWVNMVVAAFFFIFNLMGIRGYKPYHKFLIVVGLVFLVLIIGYAWTWEVN